MQSESKSKPRDQKERDDIKREDLDGDWTLVTHPRESKETGGWTSFVGSKSLEFKPKVVGK